MDKADAPRDEILSLARRYAEQREVRTWRSGLDRVPYAGRVVGADEVCRLVDAALDCWLTLGPNGDRFESELKQKTGTRDAILVNSGSSANLVALTALSSPNTPDGLRPGDEAITPATTFPSTFSPIIQNRLIPVVVDCRLGDYNASMDAIEAAIGPRTRALVLPHTLGNPFDLDRATALCRRHGLRLVEDACDALGSLWRGKPVGGFGDFGTLSFYPAHHITMGEGGAVLTNDARLALRARSIRDWGRNCWCPTGKSDTCGKRFGWTLGSLPPGYDHKYIYSEIGYNLKPTDLQAAVGLAQIARLTGFVERRRHNFNRLDSALRASGMEEHLHLPTSDPNAFVSWFAYPITVRAGAPFTRDQAVRSLEAANIETRMLFAGNILRQPAFIGVQCRVPGSLEVTDTVMRNTFVVGVYPGLTDAMVDYMADALIALRRGARS